MKVTPKHVQANYNKLKKLAIRACEKNNFEIALNYVEAAAEIMYLFCLKYADDELEEILHKASQTIKMEKYKKVNTYCINVTLLDSFALDNRGLTLIYIQALVEIGCNVQFITYQGKENGMQRIKSLLENASGENQVVFVHKKRRLSCAKEIADKMSAFKPSAIFMHVLPNDTSMLIAAGAFEGKAKRYMINITDHSFWLGKSILDYSIEFREYGCNISKKYRGVRPEKIILLPYYPAPTNREFMGFPFDSQNKKIVFSGGSIYKTSGSHIYWNIVKHILDNNNDTLFVYAGSGDKSQMTAFIKKYNYEDRFYIIEERTDLDEIMKRCTLYLSTYPFIGGLMAQYAVANGKIPLTYAGENDTNNKITPLFVRTGSEKLEYNDVEQLCQEADRLLQDEEYRKNREIKWKQYLITSNEFSQQLKKILLENQSDFEPLDIDIDTESRVTTNFAGTASDVDKYGFKICKYGLRTMVAFPVESFLAIPYIAKTIIQIAQRKLK